MRFHHSTRRGRNRLSGQLNSNSAVSRSSRWSQLSYCRETNIHFNRRLPVQYMPPPPSDEQKPTDTDSQAAELAAVSTPVPVPDPVLQPTNRWRPEDKTRTMNARELEMVAESVDDQKRAGELGQASVITTNRNRDSRIDHKNKANYARRADGIGGGAGAGAGASSSGRHNKNNNNSHIIIIDEATSGERSSSIDMESARERLIAQVEKHPFWSNKAAKRMQLTSVKQRHIYIYELISFCERRDLEWRFEPYRGGLVSAISNRKQASQSQPATPIELANGSSIFIGSTAGAEALVGANPMLWSSTVEPAVGFATRSPISRSFSNTSAGHPFSNGVSRAEAMQQQSSAGFVTPGARQEHSVPNPEHVWSIKVSSSHNNQRAEPEPFCGHVISKELPDSSFVKRCHGCQGRGRLKCSSCHGVGYEVCISCSGRGTTKSYTSFNRASYAKCHSERNSAGADDNHGGNGSSSWSKSADNQRNSRYAKANSHSAASGFGGAGSCVTESCHFCHGAGQKRCWVCAGKSYNHCLGCAGTGQLRCYLNLNVTWLNHRDEIVLNNTDQIIPKERLRLCSGLLLVDQIEDRLEPLALDGATAGISGRPEGARRSHPSSGCELLHSVSKSLLERHQQTYRNERFLKQRHKVTQIECHVVYYDWKQRRGHFVIYGDERKVYIAKYPFKSFCNIT